MFEVGDRVTILSRGPHDPYAGMHGVVQSVEHHTWGGIIETDCSVRLRPDLMLPFAFADLERHE